MRPGGAMASSDTFHIVVHGKQSHGATPWKGIDPIVTASEIVMSAQTIVSRELDINSNPAVVTFGVFDGGERFNIVPDKAELYGTVRAFDETMRQQALTSLAQHRDTRRGRAWRDGRSRNSEAGRGSVPQQSGQLQRSGADRARAGEPRQGDRRRSRARRRSLDGVRRFPAARPFGAGAERLFLRRRDAGGTGCQPAPSNHSPKFFLDEGALAIGTAAMLQAAARLSRRPSS